MRFQHIFAIVITLLLALHSPAVQAQVSNQKIQEFKDTWSNTSMARGSFIEIHSDGFRQDGSFLIQSPSIIVMQYRNGTKVTVNNGNLTVEEPGRQPISQSAGPLDRLFRPNPNIDGLITGGGTGSSETKVRLRHPTNRNRGYVDLVFDNTSNRLVGWENRFDSNNVTLQLTYN